MAWWGNIAGTALGYFRLGLSGVQIKNDAGVLSVRDAGDSAAADAKFGAWLNTDGTENFKCRAWVNFNGTGTVAIRASGNVSSITDNGTGDYTVNFTSAMTDASYAVTQAVSDVSGLYVTKLGIGVDYSAGALTYTASAFRVVVRGSSGALSDPSFANLAVFH